MVIAPPDTAALAAAAEMLRRDNRPAVLDIADALADFAAGRIDSIDRTLGIAGKPGKARNTTLARLRTRNAAIVAAAERYEGTPEEKGRALHRDLVGYLQSDYRRDVRNGRTPARRLDLFAVIEHCDGAIPGASMLAKIVRTRELNDPF